MLMPLLLKLTTMLHLQLIFGNSATQLTKLNMKQNKPPTMIIQIQHTMIQVIILMSQLKSTHQDSAQILEKTDKEFSTPSS
jgi:hypothetical protein